MAPDDLAPVIAPPTSPRPTDPALRLLALLALVAALTAIVVALTHPLGDGFDERAHYSYVRAMAADPTLWPDHETLRLLAGEALTWSDQPNYLAHPPLYHLLAAPLSALTPGDPRLLRLLDGALVTAGLVLAGLGGLARIADPLARILFVATLFGLPVTIGVAGLVNNDALMIAEIGALVFLLGRDRAPPWAIALLLAALGWTKLTGFVAGATAVGLLRLAAVAEGRARLVSAETALIAAGLLVGLAPLVVTWVQFGRPIWMPAAFPDWFDAVPPADRAGLGLVDFARLYLDHLGRRLPYRAETFHGGAILIGVFLAAATALLPTGRPGPDRTLARVGLLTTIAFVALHFVHAWASARNQGILTDLQTRYLAAIWPFLAVAVAVGLANLPPWPRRIAAALHLAALLAISVVGAAAFRLVGG